MENIPNLVVECIAASAVIVVVKLFLGFQKDAIGVLKEVVERNTAALDRFSETAGKCRYIHASGDEHQRAA